MEDHRVRNYLWAMLFTTALASTLLFAPRAYAQEGGSINGSVVDTTGAAVVGARLTVTNVATHGTRQTVSSDAGFFNFTGLPPATYSLSISAHSFRTLVMSKLTLSVSQQMTVHPVLTAGTAQQTVTVTSAPPTITTSSAAISQTVESRQIMNLPLNGRNALQLMALVPGVVQLGDGGQYGMTQMQFSTPGTRATDVNYTLDGGTNNNNFYDIASSYPNPGYRPGAYFTKQTGSIVYKSWSVHETCRKWHELESERSGGEAERVSGGVCVGRVDDDGSLPSVRDLTTDGICGGGPVYARRRGGFGRTQPGSAAAPEPDLGRGRGRGSEAAAAAPVVGAAEIEEAAGE